MTTDERRRRRRRSVLVFPATELRMALRATTSDADCVVFDLEDAVPSDQKAPARGVLTEALAELDFGDAEVGVRINAVGTPHFTDDLRAVNDLPLDAVVVPKVETTADVLTVDAALRGGRTRPVLHLAVETPLGLFECRGFCQASPLVDALIFGAGDFVAASGFSTDEAALIYPRSHLSLVASSLGIDALDLVHANVRDREGLGRSAAMGRSLGYSGKWVVHPDQVTVVNDAFSPSADETRQARRILAAMAEAQENGRGATTLDGDMLDEASIRWAHGVVARSSPP